MSSEQYRPLTPERSQEPFEKRVSDLIVKLKRRELLGAYVVGRQVAKLFASLITNSSSEQPVWQLMKRVREEGRKIQAAQPLEFTIGCIVRRVLAFIREGVLESKKSTEAEGSSPTPGHRPRSASLVKPPNPSVAGDRPPVASLSEVFSGASADDFNVVLTGRVKRFIATALEDMLADMKDSHESIASRAEQHIHTNEVVLTYGRSRTVFDFLCAVQRVPRKFEVIVAESSPSRWGHRMAKDLAEKGLSTTLITDSAVFAMMARVNIVIIGTHAVLANGGLIAHTGSHLIALAAKHYSVPVVVCTGLYKLCPLYAFDQDTFQDHNSPTAVLPFTEADDPNGHVEVLNPSYDYIPPELISLFVTNSPSCHTYAPAYIYRQLAEFYHRDDYDLDDDSLFREKEEMRR